MLKGELIPEHCSICYEYESKGLTSYRVHDSLDYIAQLEINELDDLKEIKNPYYYEIRNGNKCNLQCRMCTPNHSHLLEREFKKYGMYFYKINSSEDLGVGDYASGNSFFELLATFFGVENLQVNWYDILDEINYKPSTRILTFTRNPNSFINQVVVKWEDEVKRFESKLPDISFSIMRIGLVLSKSGGLYIICKTLS